ncbi:MAG TPA: hypothetical protein VM165_06355, partial [Planctomycetaceae bacterium]|nr:hypothetical protein [Planctomycetaceae bacterium]
MAAARYAPDVSAGEHVMVCLYSKASCAALLLSAVASGLHPAAAAGQAPAGDAASPFEMVGFIQKATLNDPKDTFSGGTITLNNHVVVVPRYTVLQMPASAVTWNELFKLAPAPYAPGQTGLALDDRPAPSTTFEVFVQGNRVGDDYIAGLIFLSQQSTNSHQGFINAIDYGVGELRVGGTPGDLRTGARVRINDPIGRFGRAMSPDVRFTIDEDNPTVRTETGYPMCLPRFDPAVADDPACPQGNRLPAATPGAFLTTFTMPPPGGDGSAVTMPDARRMAPFEVGDYITYSGNLMRDADGSYVSAWTVVANVGIFTAPGTQPVYVAIDVLLAGTGPTANVELAQEAAKRTRVEGFTTDPTNAVQVFAVDVDPCTGTATNRFWAAQAVDPGPPNGAVKGRWRFRPAAPLFDLKGFPFLPSSRDVLAVSDGGSATPLANGL